MSCSQWLYEVVSEVIDRKHVTDETESGARGSADGDNQSVQLSVLSTTELGIKDLESEYDYRLLMLTSGYPWL